MYNCIEVRKLLIQFNFENFKSFLNETSLDMTATNITEHSENLINYKKGEKYLKVAAIYGANASGKTNVLKAFSLMSYWVRNSFKEAGEREGVPQKRFKFEKEGKKGKALFEVFFEIDGKEYQYGYRADNKKIYEEWLYKRDFKFKSKYILIFERKNQEFNMNDELLKKKELLDRMNESTLAISILSGYEINDIENVYKWFLKTNVLRLGDVSFEHLLSKALPINPYKRGKEYDRFIEYVKTFDLGIEGLRIEKIGNSDSDLNEDFENGSPDIYRIFSQHVNKDTNDIEELPLQEESGGTQKMISIYSFLVKALDYGSTLIIDEMDAKLHPLLIRYIINMFQFEETNPNNAQLIFTTHNVNDLNKDLFRRDQIWFVEKDENGVSDLFSLAEYKQNDKKVRKDASYGKDYLAGRYGAIPDLKDFHVSE